VSADATLGAIERILSRGGEADDVLREVVAALHDHIPSSWVAISFVEQDNLVLGPTAGQQATDSANFRIDYQDRPVAELAVGADALTDADRAVLERVASLLGPYCLVGWDTGGEVWSP
jgi:hypothetical protein